MTTVTLHLGDCLEYMRTMQGGCVGAVVTDPPYGIGINKSHRLSTSRGFAGQTWDEKRVDKHIAYIVEKFTRLPIVIWGGNYYADLLTAERGWIAWDKLNDGRDFGEFELAWTNVDTVTRMFRKSPINMDGGKVHPTQKPLSLMKWVLENYTPPGATIFDPFMGSGTTGVACVQLGRNFIGCEIDPTYYAIAQRRIRDAQAQPNLFEVQP